MEQTEGPGDYERFVRPLGRVKAVMGQHRHRRRVRDLLQPRHRTTRRRDGARLLAQAHRHHRRRRRARRNQTRRAARGAVHQAGPQPLPASHRRRAAAHRPRRDQGRGTPGRQGPAALLRPEALGRGHRPGLQAAAGSRTRLARHEIHIGPTAGVPPTRGPHPRPHPAVLARPTPDPDRRDRHRTHLDHDRHRDAAPARRRVHRYGRHLPPTH